MKMQAGPVAMLVTLSITMLCPARTIRLVERSQPKCGIVVGDAPSRQADEVMMGDIVQTAADSVELRLNVAAHAAIERIEVRNGIEVVDVVRPFSQADLGNRIRVVWSGAEYRGRGRYRLR